MPEKKVLVVDDDVKTVDLVKLYLNRDGYEVLTAHDGVEALRVARDGNPDLIVLDLMLPDMDGLEVCRTLRDECDVPIIMLTARTTDQDKLTGLDSGADDYVTKPFSPRELAARVRAVLRRLPGERGPVEVRHGELTMNFVKREAWLAGKPLNVTDVEFKFTGGSRGWVGDGPIMLLDCSKINKLGWSAEHNSEGAIRQAIKNVLNKE